MRYYVGQARGAKTIAALEAAGFGECVNRGDYEPRRHPWFLDNGAFRDFKAGRPFDGDAFRAMFERTAAAPAPDFVVAPDVVEGGRASLDFSLEWVWELRELNAATWPGDEVPIYCAVQDGMSAADVHEAIEWFDGIFVGGSTDWKLAATPGIVRECNLAGDVPVHVGRLGSGRRITYGRIVGAASADSCIPLREQRKLELAIEANDPDLVAAALAFPVGLDMAETSVVSMIARYMLRALEARDAELDLGAAA